MEPQGVGAGAQRDLLIDCTLLKLDGSSVWTHEFFRETLRQSQGTSELEGTQRLFLLEAVPECI